MLVMRTNQTEQPSAEHIAIEEDLADQHDLYVACTCSPFQLIEDTSVQSILQDTHNRALRDRFALASLNQLRC